MSNIRKDTPSHRTGRGIRHARSYGVLLRASDRAAGRHDRGVAEGAAEADRLRLPFPSRIRATWSENDQRILACTADRIAPTSESLARAFATVERLDRELVDIEERASVLPAPRVGVGSGERHLAIELVDERRGREHDAARGRIRAQAGPVREDRDAALRECIVLRARLTEEFEVAREVSERLRQYYNRRVHTYARALRIVDSAAWEVPTAPWTERPCPWIPDGLDARLASFEHAHPAMGEVRDVV